MRSLDNHRRFTPWHLFFNPSHMGDHGLEGYVALANVLGFEYE